MIDFIKSISLAIILFGGVLFLLLLVWAVSHWTDIRFARFEYEPCDLLSEAEKKFFVVLSQAVSVPDKCLVFTKVRVLDLVQVKNTFRTKQGFWEAFNRISKRHVDFVVVNAKTLRPVIIVELDDKTHLKPVRIAKDKFLDSVLTSCGYVVHRVKVASFYRPEDLAVDMRLALDAKNHKQKT